jgi:hypothetical protein
VCKAGYRDSLAQMLTVGRTQRNAWQGIAFEDSRLMPVHKCWLN